jgi:tol-pal system protein YbgF
MNRATVVACVVAALTSGCATRAAVYQVSDDVKTVRAEVGFLRQVQEALARQLADVSTTAQAARAKNLELEATLVATIADLDRLVTRLEATDEAVKRITDSVVVSGAAAVPPSVPPPAVGPERPRENPVGSAENTYAAGLANFRGREYGQAVLDFLDVVTKHPAHALAPSAQYWIAEAYYVQHDYRQALIEFQRVVDWGPPNSKVAEALVKSGLCYRNLREAGRAQEAWRRVVREFPESPAAEQARALLAQRSPSSNFRRP